MTREMCLLGLCSMLLMACSQSPPDPMMQDKNSSVEVTTETSVKPQQVLSGGSLLSQSKAMIRNDSVADDFTISDSPERVQLGNMFESEADTARVSVGASPILKFKESVTDIPAIEGASVDINIIID